MAHGMARFRQLLGQGWPFKTDEAQEQLTAVGPGPGICKLHDTIDYHNFFVGS